MTTRPCTASVPRGVASRCLGRMASPSWERGIPSAHTPPLEGSAITCHSPWVRRRLTSCRPLQRRQFHLAELAHRTFGLDRDLDMVGRALEPVVRVLAVDQMSISRARHSITVPPGPPASPSCRSGSGCAAPCRHRPPLLLRPAPLLHVRHRHVLADAPEVAGAGGTRITRRVTIRPPGTLLDSQS